MPPIRTTRKLAASRLQQRRLCPTHGEGMSRYLRHCYKTKIVPLVREFEEAAGDPLPRRVEEHLAFVQDLYLPGLEFEVKMTPEEAHYAYIDDALEELTSCYLPRCLRKKAEVLRQALDERAYSEPPDSPTGSPTSLTLSGKYPPEDHPIFGIGGIGEGTLVKFGPKGNITYKTDDRRPVRSHEQYGHNSLQPGFWQPKQVGLILHGGHNQPIRGISGHKHRGAYSVVISGKYSDVDVDEGNVVYYSGEGGNDKVAQKRMDTLANQAMNASIVTRNPIRLFRSAKKGGKYAPPFGIRYDGLYECVGKEIRWNKKGSKYESFKLVRLERSDQPDLDDIVRESPTAKQIAHFPRMKLGY